MESLKRIRLGPTKIASGSAVYQESSLGRRLRSQAHRLDHDYRLKRSLALATEPWLYARTIRILKLDIWQTSTSDVIIAKESTLVTLLVNIKKCHIPSSASCGHVFPDRQWTAQRCSL